MRIGLVGISALYWPITAANYLSRRSDATLAAFATLGVSAKRIKDVLGLSPEEYAAQYRAKQFSDVDEMIRNEKLDALIICTPHTEHAKWVRRVAKYRLPLYMFKTFATENRDSQEIVRLGRKYQIPIAVGPSARHLPAIVAVKDLINSGAIGKPFSMHLCHHHGVIDCFHKTDWYREGKEGGPELSLGWYLTDLVLHFLGTDVARVSAEYGNFNSKGSPFMDCGKLAMRMKTGAMASCNMYFCHRFPYPSWEMDISGPNGVVCIKQEGTDPGKTVVKLFTAKGCSLIPLPDSAPHWEMFWVDDFLAKRKPALDAGFAALITEITLAARESARKGKTMELSRVKKSTNVK